MARACQKTLLEGKKGESSAAKLWQQIEVHSAELVGEDGVCLEGVGWNGGDGYLLV